MTHVNLGLEVVQDRFPLQFLRRGEEPVLRSPLDVGQDNRLEGLHTSPSRMGTGGRRRNPQSAQQAQRKKTTKAHHDKRKTHLERFQFGLLAGRVQLGEDPFPDLVVLAHFGRPVEVVDVLVAWAEQLWLGCEELTQVVLVRDNDLSQMCASGSCPIYHRAPNAGGWVNCEDRRHPTHRHRSGRVRVGVNGNVQHETTRLVNGPAHKE